MVHRLPILLRTRRHDQGQAALPGAPKYTLPSSAIGAVLPIPCAYPCVPEPLPIQETRQNDLRCCVYCDSSRRLSLQCLQPPLLLRCIATLVYRQVATSLLVLLCWLEAHVFLDQQQVKQLYVCSYILLDLPSTGIDSAMYCRGYIYRGQSTFIDLVIEN